MDVDSEQQFERAEENAGVEVAQAGTNAGTIHIAFVFGRFSVRF